MAGAAHLPTKHTANDADLCCNTSAVHVQKRAGPHRTGDVAVKLHGGLEAQLQLPFGDVGLGPRAGPDVDDVVT